jgi:thioredoxin 2
MKKLPDSVPFTQAFSFLLWVKAASGKYPLEPKPGADQPVSGAKSMYAASIVSCPHCGTKNRIPQDHDGGAAKCGRCHRPLVRDSGPSSGITLTLRCGACHAKNRVPAAKLHTAPKCGRCGEPLEHQDIESGRPVIVTDANFDQTVKRSPLPVLLYGWAPWCSVCSGTNSTVDQVAAETKGKVRVAKLNIQNNPRLASEYDILSVPSFFIFDAGNMRQHIPGAVPKHDLLLQLARFLL